MFTWIALRTQIKGGGFNPMGAELVGLKADILVNIWWWENPYELVQGEHMWGGSLTQEKEIPVNGTSGQLASERSGRPLLLPLSLREQSRIFQVSLIPEATWSILSAFSSPSVVWFISLSSLLGHFGYMLWLTIVLSTASMPVSVTPGHRLRRIFVILLRLAGWKLGTSSDLDS